MSDMPDYASKIIRDLPDWRVFLAQDIDIVAGAGAVPSGTWTQLLAYTVPAGQVLLIFDWSIAIEVAAILIGNLQFTAPTVHISYSGGSGGFHEGLSKPKRVTAGKTVRIWGLQNTGANQGMYATLGGILL